MTTASVSGSLTWGGRLSAKQKGKEVRCMRVVGNMLYGVCGHSVFEVDERPLRTYLGIIGTDSGPAWVSGDGTNLCVVDGVSGYSWNGTTLTEISFPDGFSPSSLTFQDGYFIVSKKDSGRFYISASYDPATWDALDYATAEGLADNLVCVYSHNRDLWLFGKESSEIWFNSGAAEFPFERYQGGFITVGCKSAQSVASSDVQLFWLDNDLCVRAGIGIESVVISTPQIDYQIAQLTGHDQAIGFFYTQEGHGFYQLTIADKTLVFDITTGYWHTRATGESNSRHPAQCYAYFNDKHLIGHYDNGMIYYFDLDNFTNDGEVMKAIRTAQTIHTDRKLVFHDAFEIEFEAGVGLSVSHPILGTGTDPQAVLDWSDDGGHTWSNEHSTSIGLNAEYKTRAVWRRLGRSRGRIYRVTISDPVKKVIIGAHLEGGPGRA